MAPDREVLAQFSVQLLHSFKYRFELNKLLANNTADKLLANNTADKQLENVKDIQKVIVHSVTDLANHYRPEATLCD